MEELIKQSRVLVRILDIIGLWPRKHEKRYSRLIRLLKWHLATSFLYTALMWTEMLMSKDFTYTIIVLQMALTESTVCLKIVTIYYYGKNVLHILHRWESSPIYGLHTLQEREMWRKAQRKFGIVSFLYLSASMLSVYCAFGSVFFRGYSVLPIPFWLPFDWHKPVNFWFAYCYELWTMPLTGTVNVTLDLLNCYLIYHTSLIYRMLGMRLSNIAKQVEDVQHALIENMQLHQRINKDASECEKIITYPVLVQILFSTFIVGFSVYRITKTKFSDDPITYYTIIQYGIAMSLQIFIPSYYGSMITDSSRQLMFNLYSSDWIKCSTKNQKLVLNYMQYLQKPFVLRAGYYFEIGVPIFSKVMNNAYSLLALMLNLNN